VYKIHCANILQNKRIIITIIIIIIIITLSLNDKMFQFNSTFV